MPSRRLRLSGLRVIVQRNADSSSMMPIILTDDGLTAKLPQSRVMVAAGRHQVGRVGAESAIPHPPLVTCQRRFQGESLGFCFSVHRPIRVTVHTPVPIFSHGCFIGSKRVVTVSHERDIWVVGILSGYGPDFGGMVGRTGCELLDVG